MSLELLKYFDEALVVALHGGNNLFLDNFVIVLTSAYTWIPLYIALLFLVIKNNENWKKIFLIIGVLMGTIILSNILNNLIIKPVFGRIRPFNNPALHHLLPLVKGYTAKGFSFYSSHTSNCFLILTFITLLVRNKTLSFFLLLWSLMIAWTRLYVGVHYPTDILIGILLGTLLAIIGYILYYKTYKITNEHLHFISVQYTTTGYRLADIDIVLNIFILTLIYAVFHAVLQL